jgi:hypothetical protein
MPTQVGVAARWSSCGECTLGEDRGGADPVGVHKISQLLDYAWEGGVFRSLRSRGCIHLAAVGSRVPRCLKLVHQRAPPPTVPHANIRLLRVRHVPVEAVQYTRDNKVRVRNAVAKSVLVAAVLLRDEAGEALLDALPRLGRRWRALREGRAVVHRAEEAFQGCSAARAHGLVAGAGDEAE